MVKNRILLKKISLLLHFVHNMWDQCCFFLLQDQIGSICRQSATIQLISLLMLRKKIRELSNKVITNGKHTIIQFEVYLAIVGHGTYKCGSLALILA